MSTSRVLLGITCIIARNIWNIAPCNVLMKKSAYIYPVRQYFMEKFPLSIQYFIKKYRNQMCFVRFMLDSLPLFSMSIALMLSWWNSSSSTAYPYPSIKYLNHRHCGKASSSPTISASVEVLPFNFSSTISPLSTLIP